MAKPTGACLVNRVPLRLSPSPRWTGTKGMVRKVLSKVGMKGQEGKPCNLGLPIFPAHPAVSVHPSPPHRLSASSLLRVAGSPLVYELMPVYLRALCA